MVFIIQKKKNRETSSSRKIKSHILRSFHAYVNFSGFENLTPNSRAQIVMKLLIGDL
jgi:hypothetical protein